MKAGADNRPTVGVAAIVVKSGRVLIGRDTRKGRAVYGVPGGHWESGETLKACAAREVKEESGVAVKNVQLISVHDFYRSDKGRSYVSICMRAAYRSGTLREHKGEGRLEWAWVRPKDALKLKLFSPDRVLIERY